MLHASRLAEWQKFLLKKKVRMQESLGHEKQSLCIVSKFFQTENLCGKVQQETTDGPDIQPNMYTVNYWAVSHIADKLLSGLREYAAEKT